MKTLKITSINLLFCYAIEHFRYGQSGQNAVVRYQYSPTLNNLLDKKLKEKMLKETTQGQKKQNLSQRFYYSSKKLYTKQQSCDSHRKTFLTSDIFDQDKFSSLLLMNYMTKNHQIQIRSTRKYFPSKLIKPDQFNYPRKLESFEY